MIEIKTVQKINPYNGYQYEDFWEDNKDSVYYDYKTDNQCKIPLKKEKINEN